MAVATKVPNKQQQIEAFRRLQMDPVLFSREVLHRKLYAKQEEILYKAAALPPMMSVVGCNSAGKDYVLAGDLIPWWFFRWQPEESVVVVVCPTHRQVHDIMLRELKASRDHSAMRMEGQMFETDRWEIPQIGSKTYAVGIATDDPNNIQGHHSPHLLAICSEAHGLSDDIIAAVKRLNPQMLVLSGNPFSMMGELFESHHGKRHLYETVQISANDNPNVKEGRDVFPGLMTRQMMELQKADYGEDSPYYLAAVLGQWPSTFSDAIIPLSQITAAVYRKLPFGTPEVVSCDVGAGTGNDKTVVGHRRGGVFEIPFKSTEYNVMALAGWLKNYMQEHSNVDTLVVDKVSLGEGVVARLQEQHVAVIGFMGGNPPAGPEAKRKYCDRNTECWVAMQRAFREGAIAIPDDRQLVAQLASRKFREPLSDGRIAVQSKAEMRPPPGASRLTWHSPDEADTLAMSFVASLPAVGSRGTAQVIQMARIDYGSNSHQYH